MKRSKLETFYVETFGERERPDAPVPPAPRRAARPQRPDRPGLGRRFLVRFGLAVAPLAILGIAGMMTDCDRRAASRMMPDMVRSTLCARRNLTAQSAGLDATFRTLGDRLR